MRGDHERHWRGFPPDLELLIEGDIDDLPPLRKPRAEDFGLPPGVWIPKEHGDPRLSAFEAAERAYLEQETEGRIPAFKFSSNDGWWVTPAEIQRSLAVVDALTEAQRDELARDWPTQIERFWQFVAWLREAVALGGFEVG